MTSDRNARLRHLPKVDALADDPAFGDLTARLGRPAVLDACRVAVDAARARLLAEGAAEPAAVVAAEVARAATALRLLPMQRVLNATGVILHTNLGRAPLGPAVVAEALALAAGAPTLELDLASGARGVRGAFVRQRLARLCGAEDALIVNNNAAAVLLVLSALAAGREVIVSRGELVQIGGGFRVPDVVVQGGARLREVGTTNITRAAEIDASIGPDTGAVLRVHPSNYRQEGFTERPSTRAVAQAVGGRVPLIEDLGAGNLLARWEGDALPDPMAAQVLAEGADLVCFSGDKLLGGLQAGVIAGRAALVVTCAAHPLMRALRPDKLTYAVLQAVVGAYERRTPGHLAPWRYLGWSRDDLRARAHALLARHDLPAARFPVIDSLGEYGSGSLPGQTLPSVALVVAEGPACDATAARLRTGNPPVVGRIHEGRLLVDLLVLEPDDEPGLARALRALLASDSRADSGA